MRLRIESPVKKWKATSTHLHWFHAIPVVVPVVVPAADGKDGKKARCANAYTRRDQDNADAVVLM